MKIVCAPVGSCATGFNRLINPLHALANLYENTVVENLNLLDTSQIDKSDMLVTQCAIGEEAKSLLIEYKRRGKKVVIDYDDSFADLPDVKLKEFNMTSKEVTENWIEYLNLADLITVSCNALRKRVRTLTNTPTRVVRNYIRTEDYEEFKSYAPKSPDIKILYSCSDSHINDFRFIAPILKRVGESYPNVTIVSQGNINFSYVCPTYRGRAIHLDSSPYPNYHESLRTLKPSIFIAPLMPTVYNNCRSNLKYLQSSLLKAAFVGTNLPPYQEVTHGRDGFLAFTRLSWWWYLRKLVRNPDLIDKLGSHSYEQLSQFLLEDHIHLWHDAYQKVLST